MGYIKYDRDKKGLEEFVTGNERYRSVDAESAELINLLTDSRLPVGHGEERVDMCKAIEDMRAEAVEKGKLTTLRDLVRDGVLSLADAAGRAGLSTEDFQAKVAAL